MVKKKIFFTMCVGFFACNLLACSNNSGTVAKSEKQNNIHMIEESNDSGRSDKVPDPNAPVLTVISIYPINKDNNGLYKEMDAIEEMDASLLLEKLQEYSIIDSDISINKFDIQGKIANLDLNKFDKNNKLALTSLVNTFIENYELDSLNISIAGKSEQELTNLTYNKNYKEIK